MKMKCLWNYIKSRLPVLLALACLITCVSTSSIYAKYVTEKQQEINLDITGTGTITLTVNKNDNGTYTITNESNIPVYVRFTVIANWTDASGNIFANQPDYTVTITKDVNGNDNCSQLSDQYYYFNGKFPAGTITVPVIDSVSASGAPLGYENLQVQILAEGIQCFPSSDNPDAAAEQAWGATFDGNKWTSTLN